MTLVIDSSIAASWGLPDENSPAALRALSMAEAEEILVPALFRHEVRNVFLINERRRRLTETQTEAGLGLIAAMPMKEDGDGSDAAVLAYARRHSLTAYDASYLELAIRSGSSLATLDRKLVGAGVSEGLTVIADSG